MTSQDSLQGSADGDLGTASNFGPVLHTPQARNIQGEAQGIPHPESRATVMWHWKWSFLWELRQVANFDEFEDLLLFDFRLPGESLENLVRRISGFWMESSASLRPTSSFVVPGDQFVFFVFPLLGMSLVKEVSSFCWPKEVRPASTTAV